MATEESTVEKPRENKRVICFNSEVIEEVLLRLPASSLLRFRCVCKEWHDIISEPRFIIAHAQHASRCLVLFARRVWVARTVHPPRVTVIDQAWSALNWAASSIELDDQLFASCNGLLCFYRAFTIKIANPVTGQCLNLAKPGRFLISDASCLYSFGFHPTTKEYKLLHFLPEPRHWNVGDIFRFDVIQVYTLGADNWRDVRAPSSPCLVDLGIVNIDGGMYWLTEDKGTSCGRALMSFDLKEESFISIQPPPFHLDERVQKLAQGIVAYILTELDGKVCVVAFPIHQLTREVSGKIEMWMLNSVREQRWSHKYTIQLLVPGQFIPQHYFLHGEKILLLDRGDNAYFHEFPRKNDLPDESVQIEQSRAVKLFNFRPHNYDKMRSYAYVQTLVPLDAYSGAAAVRRPCPLGPALAAVPFHEFHMCGCSYCQRLLLMLARLLLRHY